MTKSEQPTTQRPLKVAIVHDWLIGGGAELVVEQLHAMYPSAPIFTSYCNDNWRKRLDNVVVTGWLQKLGRIRKYIPFLRILWFTRLDLKGYDLVISSSGAEAKGVHTPPNTLHVNYCHAPTHYYWSRFDEYLKHPGFGALNWLARLGLRVLVAPLRRWDYRAAQRPDVIIANSTHIQSEIKKYYNRESTVIHPPVYLERFNHQLINMEQRGNFVVSGRQVPYKRFDIAIEACNELGVPLVVIGDGPDTSRLRSMAGPNITFLGKASDETVEQQFAMARALIFPGTDDFGITPIEVMASGTPVVALHAGGALDYIVEGKTGEFYSPLSVDALKIALQNFKPTNYNPNAIRTHAQQFSKQSFQISFQNYIQQVLLEKTHKGVK